MFEDRHGDAAAAVEEGLLCVRQQLAAQELGRRRAAILGESFCAPTG
jgi:hypothetical protein